jgi:putative Ca2+/H+ antiporter (TMEM165/GDT1 family)
MNWEAVFSSFTLVAASEMGDKTQLLAFSLASRFRRPWTVMAGILLATLANHALASSVGVWISAYIPARVMAGILAATFIAFGLWTLRPDTLDEDEKPSRFGPLLTTAVLFFLAEMGDKTQFATIALGARFHSAVTVTLGTTLGMLATDGLAVFLGDKLATKVQGRWLRVVAACLFFLFGIASAWSAISPQVN